MDKPAVENGSNNFRAADRRAWSAMNNRLVIDLLKYVLAAALLTWVVWNNWGTAGSNGLGDVWQRHVIDGQPINAAYLLAAVAIFLPALLLTLLRWYFLVRAQDLPFKLPDALRLGLVGFFFNSFLPGSVGGDIVKAAFLAREQNRRTVAVATVIMDRVLALWALVCIVAGLGGVFWLTGHLEGEMASRCKLVVGSAGVVVGLSALVWVGMGFLPQHRSEIFAGRLLRIPKVGASAAEFWRAVWMYRCRPNSVYRTMVLSWVAQVGMVFTFWFGAHALWDGTPGAIPGLVEHFLLVPMGLVIQAAIPLPGGAGVGEIGFGKLYSYFGGAEASGVLASLVNRVIGWVVGLGGYLVYLRMRTRLATAAPAPAPADAPAKPVVAAVVGKG